MHFFLRYCRCLFLLIMLFAARMGYGQIEVSGGIDVNHPILISSYNTSTVFQQPGFGVHIGLSYKPEATQFFPTLNFGFGASKVQLQNFEHNVADIHINYLNLMLNGNFVITFRNDNCLYLLGGIGFATLHHTSPSIGGSNGQAMAVKLDSVTYERNLFPAMGVGMEYVYGAAVNRTLYLSIGAYVQYILPFDGYNKYYFSIKDLQGNFINLNPSLTGKLLFPTAYISLHYLLGDSIIFWKHKD